MIVWLECEGVVNCDGGWLLEGKFGVRVEGEEEVRKHRQAHRKWGRRGWRQGEVDVGRVTVLVRDLCLQDKRGMR